MSTQRSSLTGSGLAVSNGSMGRARKSKVSPEISRSRSMVEASVRFAAITVATPLSCAARASSTSVTAIKPDW